MTKYTNGDIIQCPHRVKSSIYLYSIYSNNTLFHKYLGGSDEHHEYPGIYFDSRDYTMYTESMSDSANASSSPNPEEERLPSWHTDDIAPGTPATAQRRPAIKRLQRRKGKV